LGKFQSIKSELLKEQPVFVEMQMQFPAIEARCEFHRVAYECVTVLI